MDTSKLYIRGPFVGQLEKAPSQNTNKLKHFIFPLTDCRVSIQAGKYYHSSFIIDDIKWSYPFLYTDEILDDASENLYCYTHFEVAIMKIDKKGFIPDWLLPIDFNIYIKDSYIENWINGPGDFIDKSTVQHILDKLADIEDGKTYEKKMLSATKIQAAFRSWSLRKNVIWNLNTQLGNDFLKLEISRQLKKDSLTNI